MSLLIVDDSKVVRIALRQALLGGGYADVLEADSAEAAFVILELQDPKAEPAAVSLVLIDHTMPGMMGDEAVERIRADGRYADLPIIMVTAHTDDGTLQRAYAAGVTDYLRKPINQMELLARVRTAHKLRASLEQKDVRERQLAQATKELLDTHKQMVRANHRLRSVIEASPAAIYTVTDGGVIESWNAGAERIFGWTAEEVVGQPLKINPPDHRFERDLIRYAMLSGETIADLETTRIHKDGHPVDISLSIAPLDYTTGIVAVAEDITERKRTDRALREAHQRLERLVSDSPVGIYAVEAETGIVRLWNPAAERMFGWTADEIIGSTLPTLPGSVRGNGRARAQQLREAVGRSLVMEQQRVHKDGTVLDVSLAMALVPGPADAGEQILVFAEDISRRKAWEQHLTDVNARLATTIDGSPVAIYSLEAETGIVGLWNPAAERMYGWTAEEVVGQRLPTWQPEEQHQDQERVQRVRDAGGYLTGLERVRLRKDGTRLNVSLSVALVPASAGQAEQLLCFCEDITARKRIDETLRRTNRKLGGIINASPTAIYSIRRDGIVETWNPGAERIFGWQAQEVVGRPVPFLPSENEPEAPLVRSVMEQGEAIANVEARRLRKDGQVIDVSISMAPVAEGFVAVVEDITERKRNERDLRSAHGRLAAVIVGSPVAIWTVGSDGMVASWNTAAERLFGWTLAEVIGKPLPIVSATQALEWRERYMALAENGIVRSAEVQRTRKDGTVVDVALSVVSLDDGTRLAMTEDISERKRAQDAVASAHARLNAIIEASPAAIFTYSAGRYGTVETWNAAAERIFGWAADEVVGKGLPVRAPAGVSEGADVLRALTLGSGLTGAETQRLRKDGSVIDVSLSLAPLGRGSMELVSVVEDITERKRTEHALKDLNHRLDAIIQASPSAIYAVDDEGLVTAWNAAAQRIFGWKAKEVLGQPLPIFLPEPTRDLGVIERALVSGKVINELEVRRLHKDGHTLDVSLSMSPLGPGTRSAIAVAEDITERKRTERALKSAHDRMSTVIHDSPIAIFSLASDDLKVKLWNAASERLFGWTADEVLGMPLPTIPPEAEQSRQLLVQEAVARGSVTGSEVVRIRKDGSRLDVSLSLAVAPSPEGGPDELLAFCEDISDRKRAESALLRSREEYRLLVDHATDIVYRAGLDGAFSYVNPAVVRVIGYTPEELLGRRFTELILDEYRARVERFYLRQYVKREESSYLEFPVATKSGDVVWVGQNATLTFSGTGEPLGFQAIVRDVSEQRANEDALQQLSLSDALTGIGNRRCFDDFLDREWRRAARERTSLALVMCDVDFFKKYNDCYGHPAGDKVLRAVGQALGTIIRRPADLAARYGGEEFALLLPNTPLEGAAQLAEKARLAVEALGIAHERSDHAMVTLSLGVAVMQPTPGSNPAALIQAADRALYAAKESGRNRVERFEGPEPSLAQSA